MATLVAENFSSISFPVEKPESDFSSRHCLGGATHKGFAETESTVYSCYVMALCPPHIDENEPSARLR
jgi:hypothetical protein